MTHQKAPSVPPPAVAPAGSTAAADGGGGGGRRPMSFPGRGSLFFGGVGRKEFRGGAAATGGGGGKRGTGNNGGAAAAGGAAAEEKGGEGGRDGGMEESGTGAEDTVPLSLRRQFVPRGLPLCQKQLAQVPIGQVMVVRAGIVTLCADGLLKLWARPNVPPPLPPLGAVMQRETSASFASRGKVRMSSAVLCVHWVWVVVFGELLLAVVHCGEML